MYIIQKLNIESEFDWFKEPIYNYNIIGYVETEAEAEKYRNSEKITNNECYYISGQKSLPQYLVEKVTKIVNESPTKSTLINLDIVEIATQSISVKPSDFIGKLFKNKNGIFNIPSSLEDVIKSNEWFGNVPVELYLVTKDTPKIGDWGIDKNGVIRRYYDLSLCVADVRTILMSTNEKLNPQFPKEMIDKLKGSKDAKILKSLYLESTNQKIDNVEPPKQPIFDYIQTSLAKGYWKTYTGTVMPIGEIDHQHLSNIYWNTLIFKESPSQSAIDELKNRFHGEILTYKPMLSFKNEISALERKGLLKWSYFGNIQIGQITYNGKIIGTLNKVI